MHDAMPADVSRHRDAVAVVVVCSTLPCLSLATMLAMMRRGDGAARCWRPAAGLPPALPTALVRRPAVMLDAVVTLALSSQSSSARDARLPPSGVGSPWLQITTFWHAPTRVMQKGLLHQRLVRRQWRPQVPIRSITIWTFGIYEGRTVVNDGLWG